MRCCAKRFESLICGAALLLFALTAQAAEISIRSPQLVANDDGYSLSADFNINFNTRLEEAVNRGIVLYFAAEFELTRSRWYWFDEQILRRSKTFRLSYHALTRQYRLSTGASSLHQSYASLDEALSVMSHVRNWQVLEKDEVKPGQPYLASLRFRLDLTQMPKTFQVSALANRDWNLSSDWLGWNFTPTELRHEPSAVAPTPAIPTAPAPAPAPAPAAPNAQPLQPAPQSPGAAPSVGAPTTGDGK